MTVLTGGVSSLIVLVEDNDKLFCAKSALAKLKVEADWQVPVRRNQAEVAWLREAAKIIPNAVPDILGEDKQNNIFAMQWLNPEDHPVWKQQLLGGNISVPVAKQVGLLLGRVHNQTATNTTIKSRFQNDADFDALRLDPYLRATANAHPAIAKRLLTICDTTYRTQLTLIHGDVSPKNILLGQKSPILLDAECATYGDPAFDLAFCLNHLILKAVHMPAYADAFQTSVKVLSENYLSNVNWEPREKLEARTAELLPALSLARIDGKSPVEYLSTTSQALVRSKAINLITNPVARLDELSSIWMEGLN